MRLIVCLLLLASLGPSGASGAVSQANQRDGESAHSGTWSARSRTGLTLGGTWTAGVDPKTGAVTGTWTLSDASGTILRRGAWSAAKSPKGWSGVALRRLRNQGGVFRHVDGGPRPETECALRRSICAGCKSCRQRGLGSRTTFRRLVDPQQVIDHAARPHA